MGNGAGKYGPGVIGEQLAAEAAKAASVKHSKYGPGVLGPDLATEAVADPEPAVAGMEVWSVADLTTALEEDPKRADEIRAAEFRRPEGPRKGALRALLIVERDREDGPRDEVQAQLEAPLAPER